MKGGDEVMGNWLEVVQGILALMPVIQMVVELIERLFKGSTGAEKKAIAFDSLIRILPAIAPLKVVPSDVLAFTIDAVVWQKNGSGEFKHADPAKTDLDWLQTFGA